MTTKEMIALLCIHNGIELPVGISAMSVLEKKLCEWKDEKMVVTPEGKDIIIDLLTATI